MLPNYQVEIGDSSRKSLVLRRQPEQLFGAAKQVVEIAIEDDKDVAMAWLKKHCKEVSWYG